MKVFYIDVNSNEAKPIEITDGSADDFYEILNCRRIDIFERYIGKVCYDIVVCDDMREDDNRPTGIDYDGNIDIIGDIAICHCDYETGAETGIDDTDVNNIYRHITHLFETAADGKIKVWPAIRGIEYELTDRPEPPENTFYEDLTIAEQFGTKAITDTFKRALNEWNYDYLYLTALIKALNDKCMCHFTAGNTKLLKVYEKHFTTADKWAEQHFNKSELEYYKKFGR